MWNLQEIFLYCKKCWFWQFDRNGLEIFCCICWKALSFINHKIAIVEIIFVKNIMYTLWTFIRIFLEKNIQTIFPCENNSPQNNEISYEVCNFPLISGNFLLIIAIFFPSFNHLFTTINIKFIFMARIKNMKQE